MSLKSGWNRSTEKPQVVEAVGGIAWKRGASAAAIIVCGVIVAWLVLRPSGEEQVSDSTATNRLIKAVTPAKTAVAEKPKKKWPKWMNVPDDWDKPYPPHAYWPDGRLKENSRYVRSITNEISEASRPIEERIFKSRSDRNIAQALMMEPGERLLGEPPKFGDHFVKTFLRSLETPIVITEEDDDVQRELKEAVIATRKDLKERYDRGEDIAKIMNDSYAEIKELSLYRQELEEQVGKIRREGRDKLSDKDVKDLIDAANQMLKDRGCLPLEATVIFERKMRMKAALMGKELEKGGKDR